MSEPGGEKPLYEETLEEGAKAISRRTGRPVEDILKDAEEDNKDNHARARQETTLPKNVIAGSENNWVKAIKNVMDRISGKKK